MIAAVDKDLIPFVEWKFNSEQIRELVNEIAANLGPKAFEGKASK